MTDYAMFANAKVFVHVWNEELSARPGTSAADALTRMSSGDYVVPLYEASPVHGDEERRILDELADRLLHRTAAEVLQVYEQLAGSVPYLLRVVGLPSERTLAETEITVPVKVEPLPSAIRTADFLRLRALDDTVASQFMGSAPTRPIQEVSRSLVASVRAAALSDRDDGALLRKLSLVAAQNVQTAAQLLAAGSRAPREADEAFLVTRAVMPGVTVASANGVLSKPQQPIARSPEDISALLVDAQSKATPSDPYNAAPAMAAIDELLGMLNADHHVVAVDDYSAFHKFRTLSRVVTQAIDLAKRPSPAGTTPTDTEEPPQNTDAAAALQGLSVEAVIAELPNGFSIERSVVAAAVASLRAGKHLLLGGPPGTGKTTLAEALCRAVVGNNYDITTATADWTTFDTIGGYIPDNAGLKFSPGVVLRSWRTDAWLIIDEVNRADIDKAFGPLFTVLSGGEGAAGRTAVLPYATVDGSPITIEWSSTTSAADGAYVITPSWRLIGTLNLADKASLFRLSFAFLRRFAVIDVPLPTESDYRALFSNWFADLGRTDLSVFIETAMAVVGGPVPIGPAIGRDFAQLVITGLLETASGKPTFESDEEALLAAARLLIVPQYEGQPPASTESLLRRVDETLPTEGLAAREGLEAALREIALS